MTKKITMYTEYQGRTHMRELSVQELGFVLEEKFERLHQYILLTGGWTPVDSSTKTVNDSSNQNITEVRE